MQGCWVPGLGNPAMLGGPLWLKRKRKHPEIIHGASGQHSNGTTNTEAAVTSTGRFCHTERKHGEDAGPGSYAERLQGTRVVVGSTGLAPGRRDGRKMKRMQKDGRKVRSNATNRTERLQKGLWGHPTMSTEGRMGGTDVLRWIRPAVPCCNATGYRTPPTEGCQ